MKICAISDLHGYLPNNIEESDLLLIAGDLIPLDIQSSYSLSEEWFKVDFNNWIASLPVDKVIIVGGNHDGFIDDKCLLFKNIIHPKCVYLEDELYEYNGIKIYGTPWCHQFGDWWFMDKDNNLARKFEKIPENVDILLCHDAPYGACDLLLQNVRWNTHEHIGGKMLRNAILEKKPSKVIVGHLHSCNHNWEQLGDSLVRNVSLKDEHYKVVYDPTYFTI